MRLQTHTMIHTDMRDCKMKIHETLLQEERDNVVGALAKDISKAQK